MIVPDGFPCDACGLLAEARGKPFTNVIEAVFSLHADVYHLTNTAKEQGFYLSNLPVFKIPRSLRIESRRQYQKGLVQYQNLYGYTRHKNSILEQTAGVHVSFTNPRNVYDSESKKCYEYNAMFDFPQLFQSLDNAFEDEIKSTKRRPGFYEIKPDGRVEYRSLPSNVDFDKLIDVLSTLMEKTW